METNELPEPKYEEGDVLKARSGNRFIVQEVIEDGLRNRIFYRGQWSHNLSEVKLFQNKIDDRTEKVGEIGPPYMFR